MNTAQVLALGEQFLQGRRVGGIEGRLRLLALLHPQAWYQVLGKDVAGADPVASELACGTHAELARRLDWAPPEVLAEGRQLRLRGTPRPGTRDRELVVTLTLEGDAISLVQEQRMPAPALQARPIALPQALKDRIDQALVQRHPMLVAHVAADGQPILGFRGSVQVFGDDQLALWIRNAEGGFVQAIAVNPRIAMMYRDEEAKATYQFQGRARVTRDPQERQRIFERCAAAERAHDFAQLGAAVVVDLDRVEGYAGLGPQGQVDGIRMLRGAQPEP